MAEEKTRDKRVRNYATVLYPESAVEHWKDVLTSSHVQTFVSPLHDKDFNPDGEPKKAHYHVLLMYEGKKSVEQVKELIDAIGGVGVEVVSSLRGYSRYLCHLDNPEKAQYSMDEVISLNGADYLSAVGLPTDKYKAIGEMMEFCDDNEIFAYCDLLQYARQFKFDWFRVLCDSSSLVMINYLKSKKWKYDMEAEQDI